MQVATHFNAHTGRFYRVDEMGRVYMLDNRNEWVKQRHLVPDDLEGAGFERCDLDPVYTKHMIRVALLWCAGVGLLLWALGHLPGLVR